MQITITQAHRQMMDEERHLAMVLILRALWDVVKVIPDDEVEAKTKVWNAINFGKVWWPDAFEEAVRNDVKAARD